MTKTEAKIIIEKVKAGKKHRMGDKSYGFTDFWYEKSENCFKHKIEDLIMNKFDENIQTEDLTEPEFIEKLMNYYEYNETAKRLF